MMQFSPIAVACQLIGKNKNGKLAPSSIKRFSYPKLITFIKKNST